MDFFYKLAMKLVVSKKEQLIAMALKAIVNLYEDHKDEFAGKIIAAVPENRRRTMHADEMVHLMDTLQRCGGEIAVAAKPLFE